ncbi:MAG: geranylgeranyl reductase family protein [Deltaproteobacteria bacterium]|nr:geranylgeranyl reductase family protein [Deltaproteobacteria bacterium]
MRFDAIVAGLGPAGATAARVLASAGLNVLALDKARFPRYKSCGGCVSTKIERILDFDIKSVVEDSIYGATFTYRSGRKMDIMSDRVVGYNVMRDRFDHYLVSKAKDAGVRIIEGFRVAGIKDNGGSVTVTGADGESYTGSFLVGADGASGFTGREYFKLDPKKAAVSITAEVPYDRGKRDFTGRLFIDFGSVPYGYGWIFPKERFLSVGIAGDAEKNGGRIKETFNDFASSHFALEGLKAERRLGWTVPTFYDGAGPSVKGRVLLTGDTGHLVDPFLGEGIYYAIRTAHAAADVIIERWRSGSADLAPYQAWLEKEIYPEFKAAEKLSGLVYNHQRLWYSIIEKDPEIMRRFYNVIRGEETSAEFYGWVYGKVKSKPWKLLRRWIDSRFLPA